jgi:hypothetical protein
MSLLSHSAIIGTDEFNTNQIDIVTLVAHEVSRCLLLRAGRQLVVIHFAPMSPMHSENECLPHRWSLMVLPGGPEFKAIACDGYEGVHSDTALARSADIPVRSNTPIPCGVRNTPWTGLKIGHCCGLKSPRSERCRQWNPGLPRAMKISEGRIRTRGRGRPLPNAGSSPRFERHNAATDSKPDRNGGSVYLVVATAIEFGLEQQAVWCTSRTCMGYGGFQKIHK